MTKRTVAIAWLDREIALSQTLHDARSTLTALSGFVDLVGGAAPPALRSACDRTIGAVEQFGRSVGLRGQVERLALGGDGAAVLLQAPALLLEVAVAGVPHRAVRLEGGEAVLRLVLEDVPVEEGSGEWSRHDVERWLGGEPGPGFAGARLRVAARLCGALGQTFQAAGEGVGEWLIQLRRAPRDA